MRKAIIVDDSSFQRDIVERTIKGWFDIVGKAENGKKGVNIVKEKRPDVVTMDIMMPEMDGIEALRKIKEADPEITVIMVTSVSQKEKMREAARKGADGYVTKAFETEDLRQAFNDALSVKLQ